MGKARKKKAQRRQGTGQSRADFEEARPASQPERQLTQFDVSPDFVRDLVRYAARHSDDPHVTRAAWGWDPGSVGHRFFSDPVIADTRDAPSLEKARFPRPAKFAVSPGHWENAVSVLARAVALDEAPPDDKAVVELADLLGPVAVIEAGHYATNWRHAGDFPETRGPLHLLGRHVLFESAYELIGNDPLTAILSVLDDRLDAAFNGNSYAPALTGRAASRALIAALSKDYRFDGPGDAECLRQLDAARATSNPLLTLISDGTVSAENSIRAGVTILAALADLARTDQPSILWRDQPSAEDAERAWLGESEPAPAPIPLWPDDSIGDRYFAVADSVAEAASAPVLADAVIPTPSELASGFAHWEIASHALIRAVVLDGVPVTDPRVGDIASALVPVVEKEFTAFSGTEQDWLTFPEASGPLYWLGEEGWIEALWALTGTDPVILILPVIARHLDEALTDSALAAMTLPPALSGTKIAQSLFRSFPHHYELPEADKQFLSELPGRDSFSNPLVDLMDAKLASPETAVPVGLAVLAALAGMCRTSATSLLG